MGRSSARGSHGGRLEFSLFHQFEDGGGPCFEVLIFDQLNKHFKSPILVALKNQIVSFGEQLQALRIGDAEPFGGLLWIGSL
jgi:hypothetical protein